MFPYIDLAHFPKYDFFTHDPASLNQIKFWFSVWSPRNHCFFQKLFSLPVVTAHASSTLCRIMHCCAPFPKSPVSSSFYCWTSHQSLLLLPSAFCFSLFIYLCYYKGSPCGSAGKESAWNVRDLGSVPGLGRAPGKGKDYPLQYSCLGNPMERGDWQAAVTKGLDMTQ